MSQQQLSIEKNKAQTHGFTLMEVIVSIAVLSIGLLGVAALISNTMHSGTSARYMNMANVLASEKLDSLNKWPQGDANVQPGGSLTGGSCSGNDYCDTITMTEESGADYESQTQIVNGTATTTTIVHTGSGCIDTPANCGVPNPSGNGATFTRRWLITSPFAVTAPGGGTTTINGASRITVVVTSQNVQPPVTFQMSMVRP
jgi:type IV pilus modification protein PilV